MICPKCAMEIKDDSKFCSECGTVLKDLPKENISENLSAPQIEEDDYVEEEAFFRVEKNGGQQAPTPYDVVPKAKRRPIPPPKAAAEQLPLHQHPKAQEPVKTVLSGPQVYTPVPPAPPTILPSQPPSVPTHVQGVAIDSGGTAKKEPPKKIMLLLGIVVAALAVAIVIMVLNLRKADAVVKIDRHDGLSTVSDQTKTSSVSGNNQEEGSTTPDVSIAEGEEIDPEAEALKAQALKEEQLIQDKAALRDAMNLYYASFIESINLENSDGLVYSTEANKKIVDYKIENPNKGYLFIAKAIIYDLSSIEVIEDETSGEKTATLHAKFTFDYRKKTETDTDWVNSSNFQKCYFIYDTASESWLVDNTEIDSTIQLGDSIDLYTF